MKKRDLSKEKKFSDDEGDSLIFRKANRFSGNNKKE